MRTVDTGRRQVLGATLVSLAGGAFSSGARASDDYPAKPIRIVVPFSPGGAMSVIARLLADKLLAPLGQPVLVDNRAGAGGNIGAAIVARSPSDGYTLLLGSPGTQSINQYFYAEPGYDGIKDFKPLSLVCKSPSLIIVHPSLPVRTLPELIAHVKQNPGLRYGHTSVGGTKHLAGELLKLKAGIDIEPVAYKGSGPLVTDISGGHVQVAIDDVITAIPLAKAGRVRALAITGQTRWPSLPDVPSVSELGGAFADYDVTAWYGLLAPAGTPAPIVNRLSSTVIEGLRNNNEVRERLVEMGVQPLGTTPDEYMAFIVSEHRRWGEVIKAAKIEIGK